MLLEIIAQATTSPDATAAALASPWGPIVYGGSTCVVSGLLIWVLTRWWPRSQSQWLESLNSIESDFREELKSERALREKTEERHRQDREIDRQQRRDDTNRLISAMDEVKVACTADRNGERHAG